MSDLCFDVVGVLGRVLERRSVSLAFGLNENGSCK